MGHPEPGHHMAAEEHLEGEEHIIAGILDGRWKNLQLPR